MKLYDKHFSSMDVNPGNSDAKLTAHRNLFPRLFFESGNLFDKIVKKLKNCTRHL